ncbi:hypothetical protein AALP_AA4G051100 [Arabis alpina]|nr:hypothetical protein AALP_AA4G051100 [Arabis alpina]
MLMSPLLGVDGPQMIPLERGGVRGLDAAMATMDRVLGKRLVTEMLPITVTSQPSLLPSSPKRPRLDPPLLVPSSDSAQGVHLSAASPIARPLPWSSSTMTLGELYLKLLDALKTAVGAAQGLTAEAEAMFCSLLSHEEVAELRASSESLVCQLEEAKLLAQSWLLEELRSGNTTVDGEVADLTGRLPTVERAHDELRVPDYSIDSLLAPRIRDSYSIIIPQNSKATNFPF